MAAHKRKPVARKKRTPAPPVPSDMAGFPERLEKLVLEELKWNYTMVSELTGFTVPAISQWANGKQFAGIKAANVVVLAEKLGVRYAWLLTGEEPKARGGKVPTVGDLDILRRIEALERAHSGGGQVPADEGNGASDLEHKPSP